MNTGLPMNTKGPNTNGSKTYGLNTYGPNTNGSKTYSLNTYEPNTHGPLPQNLGVELFKPRPSFI